MPFVLIFAGECFSTHVQLGGRLFASEEFDSSSKTEASDTKKAMKFQAAASFRSNAVVAGVSGGRGESDGEKKNSSAGRHESTLTWEANGGDTLLSNK